jgi:hypothetical protein
MGDLSLPQRMPRLSDEALVEIVTFGEKDGYLPAAVAAARNELVARGASPWTIAAVAQRLETKRNRQAELARQRLSWPSRIVFLVSSLYFFPTLLAAALELKGYKRKSEEAWIWMGLGAIFWMSLLVLISLLQHFSK